MVQTPSPIPRICHKKQRDLSLTWAPGRYLFFECFLCVVEFCLKCDMHLMALLHIAENAALDAATIDVLVEARCGVDLNFSLTVLAPSVEILDIDSSFRRF